MQKQLMTTTAMPEAIPPAAEAYRPAYCSLDDWCVISGMGKRSTYSEIGRGNLRAIKVGARTLLDVEFNMAWLRSRPPAVIRAPRSTTTPGHPSEERGDDRG